MRKYIGTVTDNVVRMMNTKYCLIPHIKGGVNSKESDLEFESYEEGDVNIEAMLRLGMRFLSKDEVLHFVKGEDIYGNKLIAPKDLVS